MQNHDDQELLEAARAGDNRALESLLERHQDQIYRFGMRMCRNSDDAQDVLQDTLLAMARGVSDFRGAASISTWLYTIARSYCIKKRRKSKFAPHEMHSLDTDDTSESARLADSSQGPEEALASRQALQALQDAIDKLEPMYRDVLVLRDIEGLTAPEVAEVLGLSVPAVKSRLHRARSSLRELVAPLLAPPAEASVAPTAKCPDVLTLFSKHLEDEISQDLCDEMERHLATCDHCRLVCDSLKHTLKLCRTSSASLAVPAKVQTKVKVALRNFLAESS